MKISSNAVSDSNDENSFSHKLLLTNTQVSRNIKADGSLGNIRLSKTQLHKITHSGGSLGNLFGPLLKTALSIIGITLKTLSKSI